MAEITVLSSNGRWRSRCCMPISCCRPLPTLPKFADDSGLAIVMPWDPQYPELLVKAARSQRCENAAAGSSPHPPPFAQA